MVLRRLAVFAGSFSLEAALAVVASGTMGEAEVLAGIESLVAKSMLAAEPAGAAMRYRLLNTTRAYILDMQVEDAEPGLLASRHAEHYRRWLERTGAEWPILPTAAERAPYLADLANVRSALERCFGAGGATDIGIGLVSAAAPVFLAMSLLTECHRWSERAIGALDAGRRGGVEEMRLQAALGLSLMFTQGNCEAARVALSRSLAIAEERDDSPHQLRMLALLHTFHHRIGEFRRAMHFARRGAAIHATAADSADGAVARSTLGSSLHHVGDLAGARAELEAALRHAPGSRRTGTIYLGFDHHIYAGVALARTLWLQGHPVQAVRRARQAVQDAARMDHPATLCIALAWALTVFIWAGDFDAVDEHSDWFVSHAEAHSLAPYLALGRGFKGELAICRGDAEGGVEALQSCLRELSAWRYGQLTASFNASLVQGLAVLGRFAEGSRLDRRDDLPGPVGRPAVPHAGAAAREGQRPPLDAAAHAGGCGGALRPVPRLEPLPRFPGVGAAHRGRPGRAVGRAGAGPRCPDASAAGVRDVRRRPRHRGSDRRGTPPGRSRLASRTEWFAKPTARLPRGTRRTKCQARMVTVGGCSKDGQTTVGPAKWPTGDLLRLRGTAAGASARRMDAVAELLDEPHGPRPMPSPDASAATPSRRTRRTHPP